MHHSSVPWKITLLYFLSWNYTWFAAHQSALFQTYDCSREISPNLYFDTLLLLEVYKIFAKKVRKGYVSWHWRVMQNLKKSWFVVSRIWWILTQALKSLKNVHFDWFLLCKVENTWVKNLQRIYVYWHWRMIKTLKRNWIVVSKLTS